MKKTRRHLPSPAPHLPQGRRRLHGRDASWAGMPFRAFAQATDLAPADRCFVFVYFSGGWDQLLAFDPRDPDVFTADRITETRILPGYNLFTDSSFPQTPNHPGEARGAGAPTSTSGPRWPTSPTTST